MPNHDNTQGNGLFEAMKSFLSATEDLRKQSEEKDFYLGKVAAAVAMTYIDRMNARIPHAIHR